LQEGREWHQGRHPGQVWAAIAELNKSVPLGRIAEPEDVADVIHFLASDAARYIADTAVEVNGAKPVY
jgi:NAD(P)-dependent dehydrogenase (short-subunit alcohol dehydrogenase family)